MEKNGSSSKKKVLLLSVFIASFPTLALSIKNIINLGLDDLIANIPIYLLLFLFLTLTIFIATYASEKIGAKKPRSDVE